MAFAFLEKPVGTIDLLIFLRRTGPTRANDLRSQAGMSHTGLYNAIERLRSLGFLYERWEPGFPSRVDYGLTTRGEEVADRLLAAEGALRESWDALNAELDASEREDRGETASRRLELLEVLGDDAYVRGEWDRALEFGNRQLELARRAGSQRHEASALLAMARVRQKRDGADAAEDLLQVASELALRLNDHGLASDAANLRGAVAERQARLDDAEARYDEAARFAERAVDERRVALARLAKGRLLGRRGRLVESYTILQGVVADLERHRDAEELASAYANLGTTAFYLDRPEALDWYEKAVEAALRVGDLRLEAYARANAAAYLIERGDLRKAKRYLDRAREMFQRIGEQRMIAGVELNAGNLFAAEGKWREAERRFDGALRIARDASNRFQEAFVLFNWGQMEKRRDDRERAGALLSEARDIFRAVGSADRLRRCEEELSSL